jgi:hypothetical protein
MAGHSKLDSVWAGFCWITGQDEDLHTPQTGGPSSALAMVSALRLHLRLVASASARSDPSAEEGPDRCDRRFGLLFHQPVT